MAAQASDVRLWCGRASVSRQRERRPASRRLALDRPTQGTFGSFRRHSRDEAGRREGAMSKSRIGIAVLVLATALSGAALGRGGGGGHGGGGHGGGGHFGGALVRRGH